MFFSYFSHYTFILKSNAIKGSTITVHTFAHDVDVQSNFEAAKILAKQVPNTQIKIRPHAENVKTGIGKNKTSNPEYLINGELADLKRIFSLEEIENTIQKAIDQGNKIVVFKNLSDINIKRIISETKGQLNKENKPFEVAYLINNKKVIKL